MMVVDVTSVGGNVAPKIFKIRKHERLSVLSDFKTSSCLAFEKFDSLRQWCKTCGDINGMMGWTKACR